MTTTVLYATLGPDVVEYIINHAECPVVFVGSVHVPAILSLIKKLPTVKAIVSLDSWTSISATGSRPGISSGEALKAWGSSVGVQVLDIVERKSPCYVAFLRDSSLTIFRTSLTQSKPSVSLRPSLTLPLLLLTAPVSVTLPE